MLLDISSQNGYFVVDRIVSDHYQLSIFYDSQYFQNTLLTKAVLELFQELPGYLCFIKNTDLQLVAINQRLADLIEVDTPKDILGMTDYDYLPPHMADAYYKDDIKVLSQGIKISNKVELVSRKGGMVDWSNTTKIPLHNPQGKVVGILGITRPYQAGIMAIQSNEDLGKAVTVIKERFSENFTIQDLADLTNTSISSFERKFKQHFNMTPKAYLLRIRIQEACHRLAQTNDTISEIAIDCGFSDQSHLTRGFKKVMQETPKLYRNRFRM